MVAACRSVAVDRRAGLGELERKRHSGARVDLRRGENSRAITGRNGTRSVDVADITVAAEGRSCSHRHIRGTGNAPIDDKFARVHGGCTGVGVVA